MMQLQIKLGFLHSLVKMTHISELDRFSVTNFSASIAILEGGLFGLPLKSIKNSVHVTVRTQFATKMQFLITIRSAAGSVLSKPIAMIPGIAMPAKDPH